MPDVIQLLNQDHRKVEELFSQFEESTSWEVCQQICQELEIHTQLEEEIVYPVLAKIDSNLEREAEKEHDEAKQLITKIRNAGANGSNLTQLMTQLEQAIEHHVKEEESGAWPKLRDGIDQSRLGDLGTRLEQRKGELMGSMTSTTSMSSSSSSSSSSDGRVTRGRLLDLTKEELYEKAKEAGIEGRSSMTKDQLADALQRQG